MAVRRDPCRLWRRPPSDALARTRLALARGLDRMEAPQCRIFFRADDCGAPSQAWTKFVDCFLRRRIPVAPALTPSWTTPPRWRALQATCAAAPELFTWHQHGRKHVNHEPVGKKMEFGPSRTLDAKALDIAQGWRRLQEIVGDSLHPIFTPPWNRVSGDVMDILLEQHFIAISRFALATPPAPPELQDLFVNLDLHTRKDHDDAKAWGAFLQSLEDAVATGWLGVMCHHQRMNKAAHEWLDGFLALLAEPVFPQMKVAPLKELAYK